MEESEIPEPSDDTLPTQVGTLKGLRKWVNQQPESRGSYGFEVRRTDGLLGWAISVDEKREKVILWR